MTRAMASRHAGIDLLMMMRTLAIRRPAAWRWRGRRVADAAHFHMTAAGAHFAATPPISLFEALAGMGAADANYFTFSPSRRRGKMMLARYGNTLARVIFGRGEL